MIINAMIKNYFPMGKHEICKTGVTHVTPATSISNQRIQAASNSLFFIHFLQRGIAHSRRTIASPELPLTVPERSTLSDDVSIEDNITIITASLEINLVSIV